jgi:hypothetical protein
MQTIKKTSDLVRSILRKDKQARNSDSYLYLKVISHTADQIGVNLHGLSVPMFLLNGAEMGFVGFETVRRARQKIQQHHPELCACESVEGFRAENEAAFRDYARSEA